MLSRDQVDAYYRDAMNNKYSIITADAIIETVDGYYIPDDQHRIDGKNIREYLESHGWFFCGEMSKTVNGNSTEVGLYIKR